MGWQYTTVPFHSQTSVWNSLYRTPDWTEPPACNSLEPIGKPGLQSHPSQHDDRQEPGTYERHRLVGHGGLRDQHVQVPEWEVDGLQPGRDKQLPETTEAVSAETFLLLVRP